LSDSLLTFLSSTFAIPQLFFDDEMRNREVESLGGWSLNLAIRQLIFGLLRQQGVTFQLVQRGLDNTCFEKGLENWRARHPEQVLDTAQEETTCVA